MSNSEDPSALAPHPATAESGCVLPGARGRSDTPLDLLASRVETLGSAQEGGTMDSPLTAIAVTVLFCADLDASTAFYRDALGAALVNADPQSAFFDLAGSKILLLSPAGAVDLVGDAVATGTGTPATGELVCFVDDIDEVVIALARRGVAFLRGPEDRRWGMRTAHFSDPDGHVWELAQSLDGRHPS